MLSMANPHPLELRERAVAAYESGEGSFVVVAARFSIASRALQRWVVLKRETGALAPYAKGGGNASPVDLECLRGLLERHPDAIARELTTAYNAGRPRKERVHRSSIFRALHRLGFVFKKNARALPNKTALTSVKNAGSS
jgi:transposase